MVRSMTGFGRSQITAEGYQVSCEIRGVNHRYLDPHIRISRRYAALEEPIKEELKKHVSRGRLELSVNIERSGQSARNIKVDKELAIAYYNYLKEFAEKLNISREIRPIDVFRLPEVFSLEDEEEGLESIWNVLQQVVAESMDDLVQMRIREGENLAADICERNQLLLSMVEELEKRAPHVVNEYGEKLRKRLSEYIDADVVDEQKLMLEIALFADRINVTEEIVRLRSHIKHLDEFMHADGAIGRKADFMVQEMFREVNTIASKANDLEMSRVVVEAKAELEKIREQLQNIE